MMTGRRLHCEKGLCPIPLADKEKVVSDAVRNNLNVKTVINRVTDLSYHFY